MDDREAQRRLMTYSLMRIVGLGIFFLGIAIIYTNLLRPGGWPQVGAIIAVVGVLDALVVPHLIKRSWDRQDNDSR